MITSQDQDLVLIILKEEGIKPSPKKGRGNLTLYQLLQRFTYPLLHGVQERENPHELAH